MTSYDPVVKSLTFSSFVERLQEAFSLTDYSDLSLFLSHLPIIGTACLATQVNVKGAPATLEQKSSHCWSAPEGANQGTAYYVVGSSFYINLATGYTNLTGSIFWQGGLVEQASWNCFLDTINLRFEPLPSISKQSGAFIATASGSLWGFESNRRGVLK